MSTLQDIKQFWSQPIGTLIKQLETRPTGLSAAEAKRRLALYGPPTTLKKD